MWRCFSQPSTRGDGRSLHQKQKSGLSGRHTRRVPPQVKVRATTNPIIQCCSGLCSPEVPVQPGSRPVRCCRSSVGAARPLRASYHTNLFTRGGQGPIAGHTRLRGRVGSSHTRWDHWLLLSDDVTGPLLPLLVPEVERPSVLQVVNVPVVTNQRCERWHQNAGIKVTIWPEMVCAGYRQGGKDSCKGDSGGPLMVQQADGRWVLIGLVSAGFSCGKPGQPGIYHRISSTSDWISFYINGRDHTSRRRRRLLFT